ncbi:MAG: hypothetical protein K2I19_09145, partial [Muribaculaceae bacterium]|nr:hypothetical protein [Muribaculaceae bacterium]
LEGLDLCFNWYYIDSNGEYPNSQNLTLTLSKTEDGVQYYSATGFLQGMLIEEVKLQPMELMYEPASGTLVLPAGQVLAQYQGSDFLVWNYRKEDQKLYTSVNFYFDYNNGTFEWRNPMQTVLQGSTQPETFTSISLVLGDITPQNEVRAMVQAGNLEFRVSQGTMYYTANLKDPNTEVETPTNVEGPLFASVERGQFVVENFGSPNLEFIVPFDVNTADQTISCENVKLFTDMGLPWYLSESSDLFNKYESEGTYKIVAPYTVANGKTTVNVGEWNAFAFDANTNEDVNYYVKFYNTKMVFNLDLNALFASVGNVAVDDANAPVEYYNLQGVRVQNPENGLYIRRQGKNVTKVIL